MNDGGQNGPNFDRASGPAEPSTWRHGVPKAEGGTVRDVPRADTGRFQRDHGWLHHLWRQRWNRKWALQPSGRSVPDGFAATEL